MAIVLGDSNFNPLGIVDAEIYYSGNWISLNDHDRYAIHPDGWGKRQITKRRSKVSSEFFSGEYTVSETADNVAETLTVWVYGKTQLDVVQNINRLVAAFGQSPFKLRTRVDDILTTRTSSGSADFTIDQSHVYMHNRMALVQMTYSLLPDQEQEVIL